ncbi:hypothetical protein [Albidovulum sp.]|uniref:hypothetical protein n=1 Tax=Albidovulum sp. TaxID=1872424 RepID=UPI002BFE61C9|nr:hypothetical protein [Paracoccaceae bacterium]HPE26292.1 hypothetical protein [Albidovulum sp.]HRV63246.1 hypothetical protein [Albidovulum sp.]
MKRMFFTLAVTASMMAAAPALADCTVKYKAKQDDPLQLRAGEAKLPDSACGSKDAAAAALAPMLAKEGWTLLAIVAILG